MKKILILLTFVFLGNALLFGQCPNDATPNPSKRIFNLSYTLEADRNAAWAALTSITFPAGTGCACGATVTILKANLVIDGPVGGDNVYRIRALTMTNNYFSGNNVSEGGFDGDIILNAGGSETCTYTGGTLPVELISFDGIKKDNQIDLTWKTASEINNEGFLVERGFKTASGLEWNRLDFIDGNGSTSITQSYSYIDRNPEEGTNYYRLKQMDYDGKYEYSSIITVEYSSKNSNISIEIFPNPTKNQLTLINGKGMATIYNVLGQPVKQLTIEANQSTVQLADLLNGQYYIQVLQEDGSIVTKQFVKVD